MESYTELKGFESFNSVDITNKIQQTMIMFFDWGFLNKGAFTNISLNHTDINGNNHSTLRRVNEPNYANGRVWETFHQNLVWESGLATNAQPIAISGVYVNGVFKAPNAAGFEHYVDYNRGRVIFNSAIAVNSTVKMEYSYKTILFDKLSALPDMSHIQTEPYNFNGFNSVSSGVWSNLLRKQTTLVAVEASPNVYYKPHSLGTGANYVYTDVLMHIFDTSDVTTSKLASFISLQKDKTIYSLDIDLMVASGAFPLDYRGAKSNNPKTYADLVNGNYRHTKVYILDSNATGSNLIENKVYHSVVKFTTETVATI